MSSIPPTFSLTSNQAPTKFVESTSPRLSDADKKTLDLSKFFYLVTAANINGNREVYCVPLNLTPPYVASYIMEKDIGPEEIAHSKLPQKKRVETLAKLFQCSVYEVTAIDPLATSKGKEEGSFFRKYKSTFKTFFNKSILNFCNEHSIETVRSIHKKKIPVNYQSYEAPSFTALSSDLSEKLVSQQDRESIVEMINVQKKYSAFKLLIQKSTLLKLASTSEPIEILFETLSSALVIQSKMAKEQKLMSLKLIDEKWNRAHWFIYRISRNMEASGSIQKAIEELESLTKGFRNISEGLATELDNLYQPFISLLKFEQTLKTPSGKKEFAKALGQLYQSKLSNLFDCTINPSLYRETLYLRLQQKAEYLKIVLDNNILNKSVDDSSLAICNCEHMVKAIEDQNWIRSLELTLSLSRFIRKNSVEDRLMDLGLDIKESHVNNVLIRCSIFVFAIQNEIEEALISPELHHSSTKDSLKELQKNFQIITKSNLPTVKLKSQALFDWAFKFKDSSSSLHTNLADLISSSSELQQILLKMKFSKKLERALNDLIDCIENKKSLSFELFTSLADDLTPFQEQFEIGLREISSLIRQIQDISFLLLLDPSIPEIPLETLRKEFMALNSILKDLIEAPTLFFNAFRQVIRIHAPNKTPKSHDIVLQFTETGAFGFNLFQTNEDQFEDFSKKMIASREVVSFQIESEEIEGAPIEARSFIPSSKAEMQAEESFEDRLHSIFQGTKTRKIYKNMANLLAEFNIKFSSDWGKGDHLKLYIRGIPVSLPKHAEWKPGTGHSIESQIQSLVAEDLSKMASHSTI